MQSFGVFFNDNKPLAITLILLTGIVAVAILIFLYRLLFGRRLHMAGGSRARQPRLGVVDAFDLDRQRQLVLVRRDNVEHLIMIGGPNDLVIESAFVRMQPNVALPLGREKDASAAPGLPVASIPAAIAGLASEPPAALAPSPAPVPVAPMVSANGRDRAIPPLDLGEPLPGVGPEALDAIAAPGPAPAPAAPPAATPTPVDVAEPTPPEPAGEASAQAEPEPELPARPVAPASRFASSLQPRPPVTAPLTPRPTLPPRPAGPVPPRPTTMGPRPLGAPLSRGTSAASLRRDPPPPAVPATPVGPQPAVETDPVETKPDQRDDAPPTAPAVPAESLRPTPAATANAKPSGTSPDRPPIGALPTTLDTLESLEEEMARLLGRPPAGPGKT